MGTIEHSAAPATSKAGRRPHLRGSAWSALSTLFGLLFSWMELARQRRALQALDDNLLKDIGLSRADVEKETAKPFWQP